MKYPKLKGTLILLTISLLIGCTAENKSIDSGKEITLSLQPKEGNPRNSEGDFIQLKDGNILFIYTHFTGGTGDNASAHLAGRISSDKGKTWTSEDENILANEGGMNIMSVSLLRLDNDEIALFYLRKNSEYDCIPLMRISTDEAKTWSEPTRCIDGEGYHVVNNDRLVQLPDGRLIFPTSLHHPDTGAEGIIMCYYSDDDGKTWLKSLEVANPENIILQEPGIIELENDKIMLFCRTESGVQYFSFSNDNGLTWSEIEPGNIRSPLSPASIERIPETGDLLLLWNNNYEQGRDGGKRTPYTMAISKDEGQSWEKIKAIESDPAGWYCYTAIEFVDDHVLLGHCAGDTRTNNGLSTTHITRLSLDWIYQDPTASPFIVLDSSGIVTLDCSDKNAQIRYTLDGTLPSDSTGLIYAKPILVSRTMLLIMQAFKSDTPSSQITSSYIGSDIYQQTYQLANDSIPGLMYYYYEGETHESANIKKIPFIDSGIIDEFSIENSKQITNFAYIFEGYINIPKDGKYTFYLNSNDGSVLYLDEHKLIDNDGAHGAYEQSSSTSLKAGMHKISVDYFQLGGGSVLNVMWKGPEITKQEIGLEFLFH